MWVFYRQVHCQCSDELYRVFVFKKIICCFVILLYSGLNFVLCSFDMMSCLLLKFLWEQFLLSFIIIMCFLSFDFIYSHSNRDSALLLLFLISSRLNLMIFSERSLFFFFFFFFCVLHRFLMRITNLDFPVHLHLGCRKELGFVL